MKASANPLATSLPVSVTAKSEKVKFESEVRMGGEHFKRCLEVDNLLVELRNQ